LLSQTNIKLSISIYPILTFKNYMKNFKSILFICLVFTTITQAQVKLGNNPTSTHPSAALEIESTNKGLLIPRLTSAERTAIGNPAIGLMVYQTDGVAGFYTYNSDAWQALGASGTNGTNGIDGKTVLNGTSNPTATVGANGDFFINTTSNTLFGPKAAGAWPTGVSLVGSAGTNGTNGQGIPTGGTSGQVLAKVNNTDFNTQWVTPSSGGSSLPAQEGNSGKLLTTDGTNLSWTDQTTKLPTTHLGHNTANFTGGVLYCSPFYAVLSSTLNGINSWIMPSSGTVTIDFYLYEDEPGTIELFEIIPSTTGTLSINGSALSSFTYTAYSGGAAVTTSLSATLTAGKIYTIRFSKTGGTAFTASSFYTVIKQQ
jgi:hypothetical protein